MSMNVGGGKGAMADINITPYIDILLVLLIIFMVITPVSQMDLKIKVPQKADNPEEAGVNPNVIVVSLGESGQVAINNEPVNLVNLGIELQEIYSARSNKNMFVSASPRVIYGDVVKIIDIAKGAGVGEVGLITEEIQ
jgi:biopolymer transport protein TolR